MISEARQDHDGDQHAVQRAALAERNEDDGFTEVLRILARRADCRRSRAADRDTAADTGETRGETCGDVAEARGVVRGDLCRGGSVSRVGDDRGDQAEGGHAEEGEDLGQHGALGAFALVEGADAEKNGYHQESGGNEHQ